jgi:hypothetical protein
MSALSAEQPKRAGLGLLTDNARMSVEGKSVALADGGKLPALPQSTDG